MCFFGLEKSLKLAKILKNDIYGNIFLHKTAENFLPISLFFILRPA